MKSLREIGEYWKAEHPDRNFERVQPLLRLSRLSHLVPVFQKNVLAPHGLSPSDYSILGALRRAGRPRQLQPEDLYNALGCTPGGLTKMIDRLERRGLVQRTNDLEDGRRARIRLTPKGAATERKAFADYSDSAERVLSPLSDDEIQQIDFALELLSAIFEAPDAGAPVPSPAETSLAEVRAALRAARPDRESADRMEAE
ncbi:MAG: MarR family transcriptional regulator [Candidatus Binatia bacterium]|nr:MarR family transcriptional regulator [Candidatus Binatia bacterium]